jgi:hypothetical protein
LPLLHTGRCERLKAGVHAVALGTAALCAAYNFASWLVRRQRHSAVNAGLYTVLALWECVHVRRHVCSHGYAAGHVRDPARPLEAEGSHPDRAVGRHSIVLSRVGADVDERWQDAWPCRLPAYPERHESPRVAAAGELDLIPVVRRRG